METEMIARAACQTRDGNIYHVPAPGRHHDVFAEMYKEGVTREEVLWADQGFVTTFGRYVDRTEALKIARDNNQIFRELPGNYTELYSEHLW